MKTDWFNNKIKMLSILMASTILTIPAFAQESTVGVPWEGIVKADDTFVFYVLAAVSVLLLILIWVVASVTKGLVADKQIWKNKWSTSAKNVAALVGTGLAFSVPTQVFAQTEEVATLIPMSDGLFWIMAILVFFLSAVLFGMLLNLNGLIKSLRSQDDANAAAEKSIWEGALSEAVPLEQEKDILMDHKYDGIMELDNKLPPWWLYMFYATIIFAFVYIGYYEFSDGPSQYDEYKTEMAVAEEEKAAFLEAAGGSIDESNVVQLTDATAIANGKAKFDMLCIACHAQSGGSTQEPLGVGPNLTDEYWIHGGGISNIFKIIKYGKPAKGMIAWEAQMSPSEMQDVASYIVSLEGSNPENAKEPQGEIWKEGDAVGVVSEEADDSEAEEGESVEVLTDAASLENGKKVFSSMCMACHAASGGSMPGGIGPNLTDEYWINGGGMNNIVNIINVGVPAKGMIPWKGTITPLQVQEVSSYILSLQGSNPENAKEAEGELWSE